MNAAKSQALQEVMEQLRSWEDPEPRTHYAGCWKNHWRCLMQLAAAWLEELSFREHNLKFMARESEVSLTIANQLLQPERTNGSVSPARMDTTKYPPEGQNVGCDHSIGIKIAADIIVTFTYCPECGEKL